jgi:Abnormal spindle-like microcephaly-assoc'd, ASPM-SPD-2-Hydin
MRKFIGACVVLLASLASACGSSGSSSTTSPTPTTTTRIIGLSGNLGFGTVTVGQSATTTLTITNSGNSPLTVSGMTGPGAFSASWTSGTIAAGGAQSVTIGFTPTASIVYSGTLTVNGDQTSGTSAAPISGTGAVVKANVVLASSTANFTCITGFCTALTFPIVNSGPGCASNVQVVTRAFGSDGNGIQLGIDIPMGVPGGSLSTFLFRVGTSVTLQSLGGFNDVRSAHTAFKTSITWTDVACQ